MRMTHFQVKAPHGLKSSTHPGAPEGTELVVNDLGITAEVRLCGCLYSYS